MSSPDQGVLVRAIEDARRILAEHFQSGRGTHREPWNVCKLYSTSTRSRLHLIE